MGDYTGPSGIGQVAMTVGSVEEGRDYYRDRVGLELLFEAGGMAFFECGGLRLMLGEPEGGGEAPGSGGTLVYFEVADIAEAHAALEGRGVEFIQAPRRVAEMDGTALWLAFFRDPWGNVLALMSEVAVAG